MDTQTIIRQIMMEIDDHRLYTPGILVGEVLLTRWNPSLCTERPKQESLKQPFTLSCWRGLSERPKPNRSGAMTRTPALTKMGIILR